MNRAYRLVWSAAKKVWIVAAEIISGKGNCPWGTVSVSKGQQAVQKWSSGSASTRPPLLMALEPRFMFDAAGAATSALVDRHRPETDCGEGIRIFKTYRR